MAKAARMAVPRGTTPAEIENCCALLGINASEEAAAWPASYALKAWAEREFAFEASPLIEGCAMGLEVVGSQALPQRGLLVRQQATWRRKASTLYPGPAPPCLLGAVVAAAEAEAFHAASADEFHLLEESARTLNSDLLEDDDEEKEDDEDDEDDYEYDDGLDEGVVDDDDDDEDDDDDDDDGLYGAVVLVAAAARLQSYPQATYVPSQGPRLSLDGKFRLQALVQAAAAEKKAECERRVDQGEEGWLLV